MFKKVIALFCLLIYATTSFSYTYPKKDNVEHYLEMGGYNQDDILRLYKGIARGTVTEKEFKFRIELALVGYKKKDADDFIETGVDRKELEQRMILKELGYNQESIDVIMSTVRILKLKAKQETDQKPEIVKPKPAVQNLADRIRNVYPFVKEAGKEHEIKEALILAVIHQESRFVPNAVSKAGAGGLMQLMPATARELGVKNRFNPRENIFGGTKYLRQLMDDFENDLDLVLAAYNAGPARVAKLGRIPRILETLDYVTNVKEYYEHYGKQFKD